MLFRAAEPAPRSSCACPLVVVVPAARTLLDRGFMTFRTMGRLLPKRDIQFGIWLAVSCVIAVIRVPVSAGGSPRRLAQ
jgi:hypothetical protein